MQGEFAAASRFLASQNLVTNASTSNIPKSHHFEITHSEICDFHSLATANLETEDEAI